jgi:molecular chaperone GrpE
MAPEDVNVSDAEASVEDASAETSGGEAVEALEADIGAVQHDVEELLARALDAEATRDEYLRDLQRLAADFDNYRKRVLREQEAFAARASAGLVERLLPVVDDLERALDAAEHHEEAKVVEGVRLTRDALLATLAAEGLEEIAADGAFDPHVHEALLSQPAEGAEPGSIVQVVQRGYRLGDTVIRPARVVVAAEE